MPSRDCASQLVTLEEVFAQAYVIYAGEPDIIAAITAWELAIVVQKATVICRFKVIRIAVNRRSTEGGVRLVDTPIIQWQIVPRVL
jgi:hypothetical protein